MTMNPLFPVRIGAWGRFEERPPTKGTKIQISAGRPDWIRELRSADGRTTAKEASRIRMGALYTEHQAALSAEHSLPVLAYYGTGRLWVQKRGVTRPDREKLSRMAGYRACLEFASDHKLFERWMEDMTLDWIQRVGMAQADGLSPSTVQTPHLDAIRSAVFALLEDSRQFFFSIGRRELVIGMADGSTLPYSALSDGQRSLIMLAADLAWRCVQLNPILGAEAPAKTEGVVLIDEIELHLHPQWQRRVLGQLHRVFPKVQFVITTHSPQVVSTAAPSWLRVIYPDGRWHGVDYTRGRDSNALLRDVFGTLSRPEFAREAIARIERLIGEGDAEAARAALEALEAELGPEDRQLQGLLWELHDLELHGPMSDGDDDA